MTMSIRITTQWHNAGPNTIWAKLALRLGREPTDAEAAMRRRRIWLSAAAKESRRTMHRIS